MKPWKAKKFLKKKLFKYSETANHVLKGNKVLRKNNEKDETLSNMYQEGMIPVTPRLNELFLSIANGLTLKQKI